MPPHLPLHAAGAGGGVGLRVVGLRVVLALGCAKVVWRVVGAAVGMATLVCAGLYMHQFPGPAPAV